MSCSRIQLYEKAASLAHQGPLVSAHPGGRVVPLLRVHPHVPWLATSIGRGLAALCAWTKGAMNFGGSGITEPLFQWIRAHLPDGKHILELGSGPVSTQYLSEHYRLTSVEDNPEYVGKFNSTYIHAPIVSGWYSLGALRDKLPHDYDLILVDGPTGSEPRRGFLNNFFLFRYDVPIIFDDTWRQAEREMALEIAQKRSRQFRDYGEFIVVLV